VRICYLLAVDKEKFSRAFLVLLLSLVTALFLYMIRGFLGVLLLAALAAGLLYPIHRRVLRLLRGRRAAASLLTILFLLVIAVGPISVLLGLVAGEALHIARVAGPWVSERLAEPGRLLEAIPGGEGLAPYEPEILRRAGEAVESVGSFLFGSISAATRGTVAFFFRFFLFLYALFFFLVDGAAILRRIFDYVPMTDDDKMRLADRFLSVTRATVKGTLVIGVVQGTLAGAAFAVAGIDSALFWGALMILLSTVPGVGTAIVWLPAGVILLARGKTGEAIFLLLFCALVVGTVDNLIRPRLVGRDTKMHPLLVLFSTLGGLLLFGVIGFLVGPIVGALFITVWDIAAQAFRGPSPEGSC
jgi:predicted PurR-regulated permease PerM